MVRVAKLFQTFTHKLEIFIVLYQFLIGFYQLIKSSNNISIKKYLGKYKELFRVEIKFNYINTMINYNNET